MLNEELNQEMTSRIILRFYNLASTISMEIENIPEEMDSIILGDFNPLYEKAKEKDKDLARFLMGILYAVKSKDAATTALAVMAYLGLEMVSLDDHHQDEFQEVEDLDGFLL